MPTPPAREKLSALTLQTRSRIRAAALQLFNEKGSDHATTHDIAAAAGISPGNLYYHYKNKETIIADIFAEMEIFSNRQWIERGPENSRESFVDFNQFFFGNLSRYRFFFREFSSLLQKDPVLKKMWRHYNEALRGTLERAARLWIQAGVMKKFASDEELAAFIDNAWVIIHFSMSYLESKRTLSDAEAQRESLELLVRFLRPYHTEKGKRAMDLYLLEQ